jgi:Cys-tRNA synthase (O-phospho-L-seryl-tRNA:Cys-tRNA synthase)
MYHLEYGTLHAIAQGMETTNTRYQILGTTDEVTSCDCCGRTNLKKTVALLVNDFPKFFGVDCAAAAMGFSKKHITHKAERADWRNENPEAAAREDRNNAQMAALRERCNRMF